MCGHTLSDQNTKLGPAYGRFAAGSPASESTSRVEVSLIVFYILFFLWSKWRSLGYKHRSLHFVAIYHRVHVFIGSKG